jgi:hypothetical protein
MWKPYNAGGDISRQKMLTSSKFRFYDAVTVDVHTGEKKNYELKHSTIGLGRGRSKKGGNAIRTTLPIKR